MQAKAPNFHNAVIEGVLRPSNQTYHSEIWRYIVDTSYWKKLEGNFHSHLVDLRNFWLETDHKKFRDWTKISALGRGGVPRSAYRKNGQAAEAAPPMATGHESLETLVNSEMIHIDI